MAAPRIPDPNAPASTYSPPPSSKYARRYPGLTRRQLEIATQAHDPGRVPDTVAPPPSVVQIDPVTIARRAAAANLNRLSRNSLIITPATTQLGGGYVPPGP